MRLNPRAALASVSMLLALSLTATACSGDDGSDDGGSELPSGDPAAFAIETRTTIGKVEGRLAKRDRRQLANSITDVVQRWFNKAYVAGEYPRTDFHDAFPGFTPGARDAAHKDRALMSNQVIGRRISAVTPKQSRLWLDVLAVRKRPVAVTARFRLAFRTEGDLSRRVGVRGRLMLTRANSGWRIFGYDVARGSTA